MLYHWTTREVPQAYFFYLGVYFQSGLYPIAEVVCVLLVNSHPPFRRGLLGVWSTGAEHEPQNPVIQAGSQFSPTAYLLPAFRAQSLMTPQMGNTASHGKEILLHITVF